MSDCPVNGWSEMENNSDFKTDPEFPSEEDEDESN